MPETTQEPLVIGGRKFCESPHTTFEQDFFLMHRLEKAGLSAMVQEIGDASADLTSFAKTILLRAYQSGELFAIMGGLLVEVGTKFSEASALANAQFFADLSSQDDKEKLRSVMAAIVVSFFTNAASSFATSPKSSEPSSPSGLPFSPSSSESESKSDGRDPSVAHETSESGTTSFAHSPDTTQISLIE